MRKQPDAIDAVLEQLKKNNAMLRNQVEELGKRFDGMDKTVKDIFNSLVELISPSRSADKEPTRKRKKPSYTTKKGGGGTDRTAKPRGRS